MTSRSVRRPLRAAHRGVAGPRSLRSAGWPGRGRSGRRGRGHEKAWRGEVEGCSGANQAGADVRPGEVGHAVGDQGDQVACGLSGVEQLIEGGVHLAVGEEAAPLGARGFCASDRCGVGVAVVAVAANPITPPPDPASH